MKCPWISRGGLVCAVALALAICLVPICQVATAAHEEGVVVLRSGGVLHGKVSTSGERYEVTRPNSVVDVQATQVLLVADSMLDAYQRQRQQLPHDTAEAHLGLAEWCLRYNLVQPAAQELGDARRLDPHDPRVALLERRLAVANEAKPQAKGETIVGTHEDTSAKDELRMLEALVADLPPGVVERFARKVQPLLVNNCTTSGCHHPAGEQEFQLDRAVLHGLSNRRITLRNLVATLDLVNRDTPQQSDLLSIPRRTHGGMRRPVLGPRQELQLVQLVDWVGLVTETGVTAEPIAAAADPVAEKIQSAAPWNAHGRPPRFVDRHVVPANAEEGAESLFPRQPNRFGAELKPWAPKDAFDPEIFNRQKQNAAAQQKTSSEQPPATR